jgi:hypothetical protein
MSAERTIRFLKEAQKVLREAKRTVREFGDAVKAIIVAATGVYGAIEILRHLIHR